MKKILLIISVIFFTQLSGQNNNKNESISNFGNLIDNSKSTNIEPVEIKLCNFIPKAPSLNENRFYLKCLFENKVDTNQSVTESSGYGHLTVYSLLNDTMAIVITAKNISIENENDILNICKTSSLDFTTKKEQLNLDVKLLIFNSKISLHELMPSDMLPTNYPKPKIIITANSGTVNTATSKTLKMRYMKIHNEWVLNEANGGFLCSMYLCNITFENDSVFYVLKKHLILDVYAGWYA